MTDRDFLELFDRIDEKYLEEAQRDQRIRRISRQRIFNTLSTIAACLAVTVAAVLLTSSFIDSGQFALINSNSSQYSSDSAPAAGSTRPEESSEPSDTPSATLMLGSGSLSFPWNNVDFELPKEDWYCVFGADISQTVGAVLSFSVRLSDGSLDAHIPTRLYVFADGQQTRFAYKGHETWFRDFTIVPEADYSLPLTFTADEYVKAVSVVCVFYPGDAERQFCLIQSAGNAYAEETDIPCGIDGGSVGEYVDAEESQYVSSFLNVTSDPSVIEQVAVKEIPADSAYITASMNQMFGSNDDDDPTPNPLYLIALVDGKPSNAFGAETLVLGTSDEQKEQTFLYHIPEEYLPENSTLQIIALPSAVTSWRDGDRSSKCYGIV
ncbi:MAG: hypothetical protein NC299_03330 [Lachnospiraceae bacterium]|nr:hypothetical protein [Ruminococcus sp.]MCM1274381.1 hypothetical protein [Lachnospiraceae bacterium]